MIHQLHIVKSVKLKDGGEGLAALSYAESISNVGAGVTFISRDIEGLESTFNKKNFPKSFIKYSSSKSKNLFLEFIQNYLLIINICKAEKVNLIHLHGLWSLLLVVGSIVAIKRKIPYAISPHGCLEPWALNHKPVKKFFALLMYQRFFLRNASLFFATSTQELESIRNLGLHQPVAVIPNGVDFTKSFGNKYNITNKDCKVILFLSRIHPKKGLLDLVEAWSSVRRPGWRIVIAGGDEVGHRSVVESLIFKKGICADFEFVGFVDGDLKQSCFERADVFILPTYSENFGIAIAEALANQVPVITTTAAPWQCLIENECGWWVQPGIKGISDALIQAMETDPIDLKEMGRRGQCFVRENFSWTTIGSLGYEVSLWLLNKNLKKPDVIYFN